MITGPKYNLLQDHPVLKWFPFIISGPLVVIGFVLLCVGVVFLPGALVKRWNLA